MARTSTRIIVSLVFLFGVTACASADVAGDTSIDPRDREWVLVELNGDEPLADVVVDLMITEDQLSGSGGCNRYMGGIDVDDPSLTIEPEIATTMMACPDEIMAQENAYLAALNTVTDYSASDEELQLMDADGTVVARFN
ncbi:MAG TPA: META domain-containing protein [Nitriliruptoraceae bacterium]|nr:META domain-containing protein [Nitriliruptoraceae bacterium]